MEGRSVTDLRTVYSPQQLRTALHREFLRTTRTGGALCVVLLETGDSAGHRVRRRLGRLLLNNSRVTDDAGWFDGRRLCAILPDTSARGAHAFAQRIAGLARRRGIEVSWSIYVAGSPAEAAGADDGGAGRLADRAGLSDAPLSLTAVDVRRINGHDVLRRTTRQLDCDGAGTMLPLLIRPMPVWKRAIDILGACAGLLLLGPVMAVIALLVKLTSRGPVIFRQQRAGLGGRPFTIYKFRTMVCDAEGRKAQLRPRSEQDGPAFKMADDPRVTRIGRFLRKTSLDELPQFWNVLIGDMSLVGPRPLPLDEAAACAPWQRQRLCVTPGLTCTWQVKGRSRVTFDEWMRMDLQYIRRRGLLYDLKLLVLTVPAVVLGRGAY